MHAAAAVRLSSWAIKGSGSKQHAPRKVKLFINRPSLGFSEAADFPAAQEFELSEADLEGNPLQLKCVLLFLHVMQEIVGAYPPCELQMSINTA